MLTRVAAAIVALLFCVASAAAADLSIALGADVTSIDPHYHNLTPNPITLPSTSSRRW